MSTDICKKCGSPLLAGEGTMMIRGADVKYALRNGKMDVEVGGDSGYWCEKCVSESWTGKTKEAQSEPDRKPLLSNKAMLGYEGEPTIIKLINCESMSNLAVRSHYEDLITSGALIRRDELVAWLEEERDEQSASMGNSYTVESAVYDSVLDHINKKQS